MLTSFRWIAIGVTFLLLQISYADSIKPYVQLDTFLFSEPVSIKNAFDNSQSGYKSGGRDQYGSLWVEAGIKKGHWHSAMLYREEYRYRFSKDTADLYNSLNNTHSVDPGRLYQLGLNIERFRAKGLRLAYNWIPSKHFQLQLGGSYFQTSHLLSGSLTGSAIANSNNDYDYQVNVDYAYEEDVLFGRGPVQAPDGRGYALDLTGNWNITPRLSLSANVRDISGRIRWKLAPASVGTLTSSVKTIGSDGFMTILPAIQGTHSIRDVYTQKIKLSGKAALHYQLADGQNAIHLKSRFFADRRFLGIGGEKALLSGQVSATIWPDLKVLELGYRSKKLSLAMGLDNLDIANARTFWLSLGLQ